MPALAKGEEQPDKAAKTARIGSALLEIHLRNLTRRRVADLEELGLGEA
jgi:hypothetical protein